jgi:hypothetical protein
VFKHLVELGDGRVRGSHLLQLWKHPPLEPEAIHDLLQVPDDIATPRSSGLITLFREWCARPIDLPGTYYLQVVQWLYKDNQLATGRFAALGRPIDLSMLRPNSCWPPEILLAVTGIKSARKSCLARTSGCSWEQPPSSIHGPRSRAGSWRPEPYTRVIHDEDARGGARQAESARANFLAATVCTENSIHVSESPNVGDDDRAVLPLPGPVRLAVQVEEPT